MIDMETNDLSTEGLDTEVLDLEASSLETSAGGVFKSRAMTVTYEDGSTETINILTT